jgi:hypothetical protein
MATLTQKERENSVKQTLASEAIEGYRPDADFLALLARYVSGELTMAQIDAITDEQYSQKAVVRAA